MTPQSVTAGTEKRLTLVSTTYRSAAYIDAYCRGVVALTNLAEIEVRLVMNEPDELERQTVAEYSSHYPGVFLVHEVERESIGASVNRGMFAAQAPYVAFLDVDDVREPSSLARQMAVLDENPDADFTYGDVMIVAGQGVTEGRRIVQPQFEQEEFARSCVASPTQLFRRSLLARVGGFDEQLLSGGDYDFQIRAAFNCRFIKTPGLMLYRTRYPESGSASSSRLQPLERTVVELRYGLYDKTISLHGLPYVQEAKSAYRLDEILVEGEWHPIEESVPEYSRLLRSRRASGRLLERSLGQWKRRQRVLGLVRSITPERVRRLFRSLLHKTGWSAG